LIHFLVHAQFTEDVLITLGIACPIKAGIVFEVRMSLILLGCHKTQRFADFKVGLSVSSTDEIHFGFSSLFVNKGGHRRRSLLLIIYRFGPHYALRAA